MIFLLNNKSPPIYVIQSPDLATFCNIVFQPSKPSILQELEHQFRSICVVTVTEIEVVLFDQNYSWRRLAYDLAHAIECLKMIVSWFQVDEVQSSCRRQNQIHCLNLHPLVFSIHTVYLSMSQKLSFWIFFVYLDIHFVLFHPCRHQVKFSYLLKII